MGMVAGTSLPLIIATSLHTSEAQLNEHGQVGAGLAHPYTGLWTPGVHAERRRILTPAPAQQPKLTGPDF